MAHIQKCVYCPGQVTNRAWHTECRMAYLEDTLHQLRKLAGSDVTQIDPRKPISTCQHEVVLLGIRNILRQEKWRSQTEFNEERDHNQKQKLQEVLQEDTKVGWLLGQAKKWDSEHPLYNQVVTLLGKDPEGNVLTLQT